MKWNTWEVANAGEIARALSNDKAPRRMPIEGKMLHFAVEDAGKLTTGLHQPVLVRTPSDPIAFSWNFLPMRHLYHLLEFDESHPFRWRLEHKLIQALILNHFCPDSVPVTSGLLRHFSQFTELSELDIRAELANRYVKRSLGYGSNPDDSAAKGEAAKSLVSNRSVSLPTLSEETWIIQERLQIDEEFRVHTFEDRVLDELTFMRHSNRPCKENVEGPNRFVAEVLKSLPDAFVSMSICGWDIARIGTEYRIVEVNFAGLHLSEVPGFQCSSFLAQPVWGPLVLARLLYFLEKEHRVTAAFELSPSARPEINSLYWWLARWIEVFRLSDLVNGMSRSLNEWQNDFVPEGISTKYRPAEQLLNLLVGRLRSTLSLLDK